MVDDGDIELVDIDTILDKQTVGTVSGIVKDILKYVQTLVHHVRRLDEEVETLKGDKKKLEEKIVGLENNNGTSGTTASEDLWSQLKHSKEARSDKTGIISKEKASVQKKEKNVMVFGLEKSDDEASVKEIFEVLQVTVAVDDRKLFRFKDSEEGKPGPLVVEFKEVETKRSVLKAAMKLRGSKFDKVYLNRDLTESEMVRDRELRRQRNIANAKLEYGTGNMRYGKYKFGGDDDVSNFYWGIRGGDLRRIKK
ncbi:RNA-directed DNA polymerase from mobile element jockey-like [Brachionus plicatilis]|uniref:RNA-directed DNA polymerase from mobile element jockey-like n=1 Tax=Brachionus plicatilis TaxID=10195 RepID=A0A3M7QHT1_BRAPC|nr:RNA-directed DNA polymerase from mobile element jockey-like [Brachionus plicatilis]